MESSKPDRPHHGIWPRRLPRELVVPATSLCFNLEVSAQRYPDKTAHVFFGQVLTYRALREQAEHVAGWLRSVGVQPGDRVLLFMQNCPQFVASFYGILRANAVVVPVNPMNKAEEFGHYATDAQAHVAICGREVASIVFEANALLPVGDQVRQLLVSQFVDAMPADVLDPAPSPAMEAWLRGEPAPPASKRVSVVCWSDMLAQRQAPPTHTAQPDDLAVLAYTSGTTGRPKGCMHTHRTLMSNSVGTLWAQLSAEAVSLGVVPMCHITGMVATVCAAVYAGATVVILPRWDRELVGRAIPRYRVTHWNCVPTMLIDLLASPEAHRLDLSSLRSLSGGGVAMPQAVAERLQAEFGLVFAEGYGLTETAAASHANPPERAKLQCLGVPVFGVDSRVVDPVTLRELPAGEVGEIITRGPAVFTGYWRQPQATAEAFVEVEGQRFFRTGDLGRMDEEGYFFLTDRLKRMINASGFKVWPAEVETLLYLHPAVQEACVVGARDAYRGETVKAVIVLRADARGNTDADAIIRWAQAHMAAYKVPRRIEFVEALPRSGAGKVMWRMLQEREMNA